MIRLFIIEDHPLIIYGLQTMFRNKRDGLEIIGSANEIEEALNLINPDEFDIFLLDLWLPGTQPLENIEILKENFPGKPIVILTTEESLLWKRKMVSAGVQGYLTKSSDKATIKYILTRVAAGETLFTFPIQSPLEDIKQGISPGGSIISLTPIQHMYVVLVTEGYTHQQIADKQGRSLSSVEKTFNLLRNKYNAKNNAELISFLISNRLI